MRSWRSKDLALEGRLPVRRRERKREKISGSRSMKGVKGESVWEILEKKVLGPAEVNVCLVVWNIWPPTSMVTMLESDLG